MVKRRFRAINRYRWVIPAGVTIGLAAGGIAAIRSEPSAYLAEAVLVSKTSPTAQNGTEIRPPVETLTPETLMPKEVVEATAKEVGIAPQELSQNVTIKVDTPKVDTFGAQDPAANQPTPSQSSSSQPKVAITYKDRSQTRALEVMNQLSKRIVDQSRLNTSARLRAVNSVIEENIVHIKQELEDTKRALEEYDRAQSRQPEAAQDEEINASIIQSVTANQEQQRQLQARLDEVNLQIRNVEQQLASTPTPTPAAPTPATPAPSENPEIADLRTQIQRTEAQIAELEQNVPPENPQLVALREQKAIYAEELQKREAESPPPVFGPASPPAQPEKTPNPATQQLEGTLANLRQQREALRQQLSTTVQSGEQLRQQFPSPPNRQFDPSLERARLEDQIRLKQNLLDQMEQKLEDAKATEGKPISSLAIDKSPAIAPDSARLSKNIPLTLISGGLVGLLVSTGLVLLLSTLAGKRYTVKDLRETIQKRRVPVLGVLPMVKSFLPESSPNGSLIHSPDHSLSDSPSSSPIVLQSGSPYFGYYEKLRSKLRSIENKSLRVVMLTSTTEGEGKTVTAYNLAIASALAGQRTLLIEADLRSSTSGALVGLNWQPDRQIEPLLYYTQLSEYIHFAPDVENLFIVPSVGPWYSSDLIIGSKEMQQLLEDARGRFDLVVIDTPALSHCNDALLLEPHADAIVLVTRPELTRQGALERSIDRLSKATHLRLLGVVTNGVEVQLPPAAETALFAQARQGSSQHQLPSGDSIQEVSTRDRT